MGAVVSCVRLYLLSTRYKIHVLTVRQIKAVFRTIGNVLMAIVNAIGAMCTAIINGIVALFDIIISCLTCGRGGGRRKRATHGGTGMHSSRV